MLPEETIAAAKPGRLGHPGRLLRFVYLKVSSAVPSLGPGLQRWLIRIGYTVISTGLMRGSSDVTFLNYGYAPLEDESDGSGLVLDPVDSTLR